MHYFSKNIFQVLDNDDKDYFWFEWQKVNSEDETIKVQLTKKGSEFLRRNKDFYLNHRLYRFTKIRSKYTKLFLPHLLQMESQEYGYKRDGKFTFNQLRKILQIEKINMERKVILLSVVWIRWKEILLMMVFMLIVLKQSLSNSKK